MSTNFATLLPKILIVTLLFFCATTDHTLVAQTITNITSEMSETLDEGTSDTMEELKGLVKRSGQHVEINQDFFIGLVINLITVAMIIFFIYYRNYKKLDTIFTFVAFNVVIYLLTYVLNLVKFSMGAAFGLFAIFSMLRYRTTSINMKDMTYLFIFIAVGLLSAIRMDYWEQIVIGLVIFCITYLMDSKILFKRESMKVVRFDDITLIQPHKEKELTEALIHRTGLKIHRVSIQDLDFLKDSALINVYYYED